MRRNASGVVLPLARHGQSAERAGATDLFGAFGDLDKPMGYAIDAANLGAFPTTAPRFADLFRGAEEFIAERQRPYLAFLRGMTRVVDLGAGTGALTRLLVGRVDDVIAVEPDERMRAVLTDQVAGAQAVEGTGESIPLPDSSVEAVLASSSWHWVDAARALPEVARVLVPGGTLGAVWSGPDPEGAFLVQARSLLSQRDAGAGPVGSVLADAVERPPSTLVVPEGVPFAPPEHEAFTWDVALTADDLVGLLGTLSWVITMDGDARDALFDEARRLLRELLGVEGDVTVDVAFRADAWRTRRDP
jgi:SAM-dependent methyltransferase